MSSSPNNILLFSKSKRHSWFLQKSLYKQCTAIEQKLVGDPQKRKLYTDYDVDTLDIVLKFLWEYAFGSKTRRGRKITTDELLKNLEIGKAIKILEAAKYLGVENLVDAIRKKIADILKDKSVNWVRNALGIEKDLTPEEERKIMEKNSWAWDGVDG